MICTLQVFHFALVSYIKLYRRKIIEVFLRQKKKIVCVFLKPSSPGKHVFFSPPPHFFQISRILLLTGQSWEPHSSCRVKLSSYKLGKGRICCLFSRPLNFEGRLVLLPLFAQFDLWSWKSGHSFPGQRKKDEGVVSWSKYLIKYLERSYRPWQRHTTISG